MLQNYGSALGCKSTYGKEREREGETERGRVEADKVLTRRRLMWKGVDRQAGGRGRGARSYTPNFYPSLCGG